MSHHEENPSFNTDISNQGNQGKGIQPPPTDIFIHKSVDNQQESPKSSNVQSGDPVSYHEETVRNAWFNSQHSSTYPLQGRIGYPELNWSSWEDGYHRMYSSRFYQQYPYKNINWDFYPSHRHMRHANQPTLSSKSYYSGHQKLLSDKSFPHHLIKQAQLATHYVQEAAVPSGDSPSSFQRLAITPRPTLSPGTKTPARQAEGENPPKICILALAMMIAGIPTVPVPGVKEEDMITAAQRFMTEYPDLGSDLSSIFQRKQNNESPLVQWNVPIMAMGAGKDRFSKKTREDIFLGSKQNLLVMGEISHPANWNLKGPADTC
ncbi:uncharacterized protein LOC106703019 [Latimeria chalumnae]|uniref:uncharacterized protein LOC106703019 n=1 Tax=Latimeria chalumnae TaxID=7897 RepID=UPI0006D8E601|nr:PREDICTED: spermatogenesis-associated protein 25 [Latimeria chalumnae]|eukprot:XP_014342418.1 PREDICTED: spermatogenesis-associated protein 25 [Latimeria chalumnae]